jgi:hypothetical protein
VRCRSKFWLKTGIYRGHIQPFWLVLKPALSGLIWLATGPGSKIKKTKTHFSVLCPAEWRGNRHGTEARTKSSRLAIHSKGRPANKLATRAVGGIPVQGILRRVPKRRWGGARRIGEVELGHSKNRFSSWRIAGFLSVYTCIIFRDNIRLD